MTHIAQQTQRGKEITTMKWAKNDEENALYFLKGQLSTSVFLANFYYNITLKLQVLHPTYSFSLTVSKTEWMMKLHMQRLTEHSNLYIINDAL